jgi:hypothetical protein
VSKVPDGVWQAFAKARHQVEPIDVDQDGYKYWAQNPGSQMRMRFGDKGLLIEPGREDEEWHLNMRLTGYGQDGAMLSLPVAGIESSGDRVSFKRGTVEEWYINKPGGLEQGFTLPQPDGFSADKPLLLSLALGGDLHVDWRTPGQDVGFHTATGELAFSYSKLRAFDAKGQALTATLALLDDELQIQINAGQQTAWPITVDPVFANESMLSPPVNFSAGDKLGYSVSVYYVDEQPTPIYTNDWVVLGAPYDDCVAGPDCGAVYVFRILMSNNTYSGYWDTLTASDRAPGDHFGHAVSLADNRLVIGAPAKNGNSGEAYLFGYYTSWYESTKLSGFTSTAGYPSEVDADDFFGWSVSTDGIKVVVGAKGDEEGASEYLNGAAYIITFTSTSPYYEFQDRLNSNSGSTGGDEFGYSVSISGETVAVGAPGFESAYVYLYDTDDLSWKLDKTISAPSDALGFGTAVAFSGTSVDSLVVGAPTTDSGKGNAYAYMRKTSGKKGILDKYPWDSPTGLGTIFTPPAAAAFGEAVAIHGTYIAIGAPGAYSGDGRVYIFGLVSGGWGYSRTLSSGDGIPGGLFGSSVAMYQNRIIVGTPADTCFDGSAGCGSAYLYTRPTYAAAQIYYRKSYNFGAYTALYGETAVVGAEWEPCNDAAADGGTRCGAVYVFDRLADGSWTYTEKLTASDVVGGDAFGSALALSEDTLMVSSPFAEDTDDNTSGQVYAYTRTGGAWGNEQKLGGRTNKPASTFGYAIAISGNTAIIGAPDDDNGTGYTDGAVYIYSRVGSGPWEKEQRLVDSDLTLSGGLGHSVDISGDIAIAGASKSLNGIASGEVYLFKRTSGVWTQEKALQQDVMSYAALEGDHFGTSVSIFGETVLVGADGVDNGGDNNQGAAYIFERGSGAWPLKATLTASDADPLDYFGRAVSLENNTAVISSVEAADGCVLPTDFCGATYVFTGSGANWTEQAKLEASIDVKKSNFLGVSVSISGDTVLTGADPFDDCTSDFHCGHAFINRFNCGFGGVITAGLWTQVGIPCDPGVANTVADILGDNLELPDYGTRWIMYQWAPLTAEYTALTTTSVLEQGEGYWIKSLDDAVWDVDGDLTSYTTDNSNCTSSKGCFEIPLNPPASDAAGSYRFNFIGNPANIAIKWADVRVEVDGTAYTPDEAFNRLYIGQTFSSYNGNAYESYDACTPGTEGVLESHKGFWVKVLEAASGNVVKLLIPNGGALGCEDPAYPVAALYPAQPDKSKGLFASFFDWLITPVSAAQPDWQQEWYLRLLAESPPDGLKDHSNVLGQLLDSQAGYDRHDLPELDPFAAPYLTIVFPHDDWLDNSDNYTSDYHAADYWAADQWVFQVKSDDPDRDVTLRWDAVHLLEGIWTQGNGKRSRGRGKQEDAANLMTRMWLEDVETGKRVEAVVDGLVQNYQFNMDGLNVRTFRWVLNDPNGKPPKAPKGYPDGNMILHLLPAGLDRLDKPSRPGQ